MYQSICIGLALALFGYARPVQAQDYLDKVVESARKESNIPGIAVAVVKDGEVAVSKGYGVRRVGDPLPVTPHTLFAIGSNTKLFTSVALAMLVDEGKIDWDDRVVDRLPGFQMSDAYVTREMRVRDLLCHRSGLSLGAGDLMFWPGTDLTMEDINYRLRFVPLATSFRSGYAYDNILYDSAGAVIQRISGKSWSDFMRERILQPLGMRDSKTSIRLVDSSSDVVAPHALVEGKLTPLNHRPLDNMAPAGAIVSSADDMSRWVITLLNKGKLPNGQTLYSEAQARKLWTPLTIIPNGGPPPELAEMRANFVSYAMGDAITEYRGQLMVTHTGGVQGMVSIVEMIPDLKLGVVVLTNQEATAGLFSIANTVLDHYLSAPPKDWVSSFSAVVKRHHEDAESAVKGQEAKRETSTKPSLPPSAYTGRYRDPWYGDVVIESKDKQLGIRFTHSPGLSGRLDHWQQDTFIARWDDRSLDADAYVSFWLNADGTVNQIKMVPVSPLTDFSFDFQDLVLKPAANDAAPY